MGVSALGFSEYLALVGQNLVDVVFQVVLMHQVFDLCQVPIGVVCDSASQFHGLLKQLVRWIDVIDQPAAEGFIRWEQFPG